MINKDLNKLGYFIILLQNQKKFKLENFNVSDILKTYFIIMPKTLKQNKKYCSSVK
jgi:hypothetical protein